ncbi:hypothetical protein ES708_10251 [subsurface metagenome]
MTTRIKDKPARWKTYWTPKELEYLSNHYGLISDADLAHHLHRTEGAIMLAAKNKLHGQRKRDNFYTAAEAARCLEVYPKAIAYWVGRGWLTGKKALIRQGLYFLWLITEENIVECLRKRPWLVDFERMERSYFRSVVIEEWKRDPWYICDQVAPLLSVKAQNTVHSYIHLGWLPAEKKPGGSQGVWIIRRSAVQAFLNNDPRAQYKYSHISASRRKPIIGAGRPSKLLIIWLIECPACGELVRIIAPPPNYTVYRSRKGS